jgi:hypothetical protein
MSHTITVTIEPGTPPALMVAICKDYNCFAKRLGASLYEIKTDDVTNFFWLGANLHNRLVNQTN